MKKVYFVTKNESKYKEAKEALKEIQQEKLESEKWELIHLKDDIAETESNDSKEIVRKKALSAFKKWRRIVLVEQTTLNIPVLNELLGMDNSYILKGEKAEDQKESILNEIVEYCKSKENFQANAVTNYCLCDGKKFYYGEGRTEGSIKEKYKENTDGFGWDSIFWENGAEKKKTSMRKKALKDLVQNIGDSAFFISTDNYKNRIEDLRKLIKEGKVMLFIGAGISAAAGLPAWGDLIGQLGKKEEFEPEVFQAYGDNMALAEYMKIKNENATNEHLKKKFKIEKSDKRDFKGIEGLYDLIFEMNVSVIYTTNFDNLIESYLEKRKEKDFCVCRKIEDIQRCKEGTLRIMKFHGDIDQLGEECKKSEMVFTESEYYKRLRFDSFMDIQLQADLQKYHVLFLGYSLSDVNVKMLMYRARTRWGETKSLESYIFTATPNLIQKEVFEKSNIISISNDETDKYEATKNFLEDLLDTMKKSL